MEWSDQQIGQLRKLWDDGVSTAQIGRTIGFSKNAVVGKAHRLGLPSRPSPVKRDGPPREPKVVREPKVTLQPLSSLDAAGAASATIAAPPAAPPAPRRPVVAAKPVFLPPARPAPPPPAPKYGPVVDCCWPIGEPGTKAFRFCDHPSDPGKPYCGDHAKLAYTKTRDIRDCDPEAGRMA